MRSMNQTIDLRKTGTSKYDDNKTDIKSLRWHWAPRRHVYWRAPAFPFCTFIYPPLFFFMAERFIAAAVVFHVICIKEWGKHPLPSLETLTPLWFIIPVNNLQNIQSLRLHCDRLKRTSSFKTTRGMFRTESLSSRSLQAECTVGCSGLVRASSLAGNFI